MVKNRGKVRKRFTNFLSAYEHLRTLRFVYELYDSFTTCVFGLRTWGFVYELGVSFANLRVCLRTLDFISKFVNRLRTSLFSFTFWGNWRTSGFWFDWHWLTIVLWLVGELQEKSRSFCELFERKIDHSCQFKSSPISQNTLSTSLWGNRWTWGRKIGTYRKTWQSWKRDRDKPSK